MFESSTWLTGSAFSLSSVESLSSQLSQFEAKIRVFRLRSDQNVFKKYVKMQKFHETGFSTELNKQSSYQLDLYNIVFIYLTFPGMSRVNV